MQANAPASIDSRLAAARARFERDDPARAEALLRALHAETPAHAGAGMMLAEVLRSQGRLSAACDVLLEVCRGNGFEPSLALRCADFVRQCDRHAVAARICEDALARGGVPAEMLALAGNVAREAGDFGLARTRYLAALDAGIDLERNHVLGALANTRHYDDPADAEIRRFEGHFADARGSARARAAAGFALAKAYNDLADFAAAAGTLREANALVGAVQPWDAAAWRHFVATRMQDVVVPAAQPADKNFVPVFIVGVPRSGTTLTATLLSQSTAARDRGELRALRFIGEQLTAGGHLRNPAALAEAARLYRTLAVQDDTPTTWYLDQDPLNFRWLHVAAAMFPQARVIHLRRDHRDVALSLWGQDFAHPDLAFAYDFGDMAAFMDGQVALMQRWQTELPLAILELDYEALVGDPDTARATLGDFIGAPVQKPIAADPAPVQSASVWQARQPVYKTSVGRWRHYAPYVPELARFVQSHA